MPHLFALKWWDRMPWSWFSECFFKPTLSLFSFTFIKRLFSSSFSSIRVVSSVYLRLLIFLPAILIPACALSSPAFCMMYFAYKLNKHGDNIQPWHTPFLIWNQSVPIHCFSWYTLGGNVHPWHTPFPIWNQSVVPCPVLTVASWPAYRFLRRQVR